MHRWNSVMANSRSALMTASSHERRDAEGIGRRGEPRPTMPRGVRGTGDHGADRSEPAVLLQTERTVISQEDAR
jgi:hypothetical protein